MCDLPFGIRFVTELDLSQMKRYPDRSGTAEYFDCPFCGGKRKLHVDYQKNAWRCNKCSDSTTGRGQGGILDLHAQIKGISRKDAYRELMAIWNSSDEEKRTAMTSPVLPTVTHESKPGPRNWRDAVYRALLSDLPLSERHREDLRRRGLTDDQIDHSLIRSMPACGTNTFAERALYESGIIHIDDPEECISMWRKLFKEKGSIIPGFWQHQDGTIRLVRNDGYLIPVVDCDGMISGLQIRHDPLPDDVTEWQKENYHRYSWLSSSWKNQGCAVTGISQISYSGFPNTERMPEGICLTEGCLKGFITSQLTNWPVIALIGVSNYSQLPDELKLLKERGVQRIHMMLDMDYHSNKHVADSRNRIIQMVTESGIKTIQDEWDPAYKGIDDWMLYLKGQE